MSRYIYDDQEYNNDSISRRGEYREVYLDEGYADGGAGGEEYYVSNGQYGQERPRRRKRHPFLKLLLFIAVLVGLYFIAMSSLFGIDRITVTGNMRFTGEQIQQLSGINKGDNIFKTNLGKAEDKVKKDPYIKSVTISRKLPNKITIAVDERIDGFCVKIGKKYALLDSGGIVLSVSSVLPNVTLVDGLDVTDAMEGSKIEAGKTLLLADTIDFLNTIRDNGLYFNRVDATESTVYAYLQDDLICEGTYDMIKKDIGELKLVIADLQKRKVKSGTIIVNGSGSCTYSKEVRGGN
jgi:cell division protein FtsQ